MNQIGFKNFRKFKELAPLDLGPITMFVGENNAGKSTVVKALLTVLDFIKTRVSSLEDDSWLKINFYFNKSIHTHVGTFERARYNYAEEDEPITFIFSYDNRQYEIDVMPSDESDVYGMVSRIKVTLIPFNIDIIYSLKTDRTMSIVFHAHPHDKFNTTNTNLLNLTKKYFRGVSNDIEIETAIIQDIRFTSEYVIDALLLSFHERLKATYENFTSRALSKNERGIFGLTNDAIDFLIKKKSILTSPDFRNAKQPDMDVEYIYAHTVTQTIIFDAEKKGDYFVNTVHEYANYNVGWDNHIRDFIQRWMSEFNIGFDYRIISVGGEAHLVKIKNKDGKEVDLADKGMGSIQLMTLLFRIATKMVEAGVNYDKKNVNTLLIVEEPEQNLHPQLQSKLADLLYELSEQYNIRFIVETHSEYLIRKSQYIVGDHNRRIPGFLNPFKVYYFTPDGEPYNMPYAASGRFEEQFGPGFFDEATKWNREILRNENAR